MFRPCIDLRDGTVVQIVGGTLRDDPADRTAPRRSTSSAPGRAILVRRPLPRRRPARRARDHARTGQRATPRSTRLAAWPGGMQVGGGITVDRTRGDWLDAGASHVIVTSWLFVDGELSTARLQALVARDRARAVGDRPVLSLARRRTTGSSPSAGSGSATLRVDAGGAAATSAASCAEFLVHGVDVEGLAAGDRPRTGASSSPSTRRSPPPTPAGPGRSTTCRPCTTSAAAGRPHDRLGPRHLRRRAASATPTASPSTAPTPDAPYPPHLGFPAAGRTRKSRPCGAGSPGIRGSGRSRGDHLTSTVAPASVRAALAFSASSLLAFSRIGLRGAVDEVLGFLQAQAGELAHDLDDLDLLGAGFGEDDVELVLLLFDGGSGGAARHQRRRRRREPRR